MIKAECSSIRNDKLVVYKEKGSTIRIVNPDSKDINCIVVDGCAITDGPRCDLLFVHDDIIEVFVELKGADVEKACLQICATIQQLSKDKKREKHSVIVSSRCPRISSKIQRLKLQMKKNFNSSLKIKNIVCEHKI